MLRAAATPSPFQTNTYLENEVFVEDGRQCLLAHFGGAARAVVRQQKHFDKGVTWEAVRASPCNRQNPNGVMSAFEQEGGLVRPLDICPRRREGGILL